MIVAHPSHIRDEVVPLADRHTLAVQSWLSTRSPQAKRFHGIGVTAGSSGLAVPLLNLALGGDYPDGTPDEVIDDEIEAVKTFFAQRGVCWMWWLGPTPRRSDITRHLHRHGLTHHQALPAMVAPLPAQFPPLNPKVQVWQAASRADLETASTIRRVAFQFPAGTALSYFENMAEDWLRGVYVMATHPEWQRRGLGKAILARILSDASADGHSLIVLTAGPKGYPLYSQFGFEHIFDYYLAWEERESPT
jgi:GNAT superfamily N-acetyltransferase